MAVTRLLEWIFAFYFLTHIPITLLIDLQGLVSGLHPESSLVFGGILPWMLGILFLIKRIAAPSWIGSLWVKQWLKWYTAGSKDSLLVDPPVWFKSFMYCEAVLQFPFFFVATYAFFKGSCKWIRTPAIIYATHVVTSLIPILAHILFADFSKSKYPAPDTLQERLTLSAIYFPYLLIPLLLLITMLISPRYNQIEKKKKK